jgi:hypothetical protein
MRAAIFICLGVLYLNFVQAENGLDLQRNSALHNIRLLRDQLTVSGGATAQDSLRGHVVTVLNYTATLSDSNQLKQIQKYFSSASKAVAASGPTGREAVYRQIDRDLALKLSWYDSISTLHIVTSSEVFKSCKITVAISISGITKTTGRYSLRWAYFFGNSVKSTVLADAFYDTSKEFTLPFNVDLLLPGEITFWLVDADSPNLKYICTTDFYPLKPGDKHIDIAFIPLTK